MTILNDALHAYLTPLLQKHAAGQAVIYDDLIHAWQATEGILKTDFDPTVSKQMRDLHESQLRAYQEAARVALTEYVHSASLPVASEEDEEELYVDRVVASIPRPNWRVEDQVWEEAWAAPLREKARVAFSANEDDEGDDGEEEEEEEDVEEVEEGEEKTIVKSNNSSTPAKQTISKKRTIPTKAGKPLLKKQALGTAKAAVAQRASRGRRARRGGRGGGAAK